LLELSNKSSIDADRIVNVMSQVRNFHSFTVFSDSPNKALSLLRAGTKNKEIYTKELTAPETIWEASRAAVFIGTSSKISYWVLMLRLASSKQLLTFMPLEDSQTIATIYPSSIDINYY
jgi:hypothetical protein